MTKTNVSLTVRQRATIMQTKTIFPKMSVAMVAYKKVLEPRCGHFQT